DMIDGRIVIDVQSRAQYAFCIRLRSFISYSDRIYTTGDADRDRTDEKVCAKPSSAFECHDQIDSKSATAARPQPGSSHPRRLRPQSSRDVAYRARKRLWCRLER